MFLSTTKGWRGMIFRGDRLHMLWKNGKTFSVKWCENMWITASLVGSKNHTSPESISRRILTMWGFAVKGRGVYASEGDRAHSFWSSYPIHQPPLGKTLGSFLCTDSVITPSIQKVPFPTSTSQQCSPEEKPSEPRTHKLLNLSGVSKTGGLGMSVWSSLSSSLSLTLVRSGERMSCEWAVFGSKITGAGKKKPKSQLVF